MSSGPKDKNVPLRRVTRMYNNLSKKPRYLSRALNPNTPTTKNNETVRLSSGSDDKGSYIFPNVVMKDGKLHKFNSMKKAFNYSKDNNLLLRFKKDEDAKYFARHFSKLIASKRNAR